MHLPDSPLSLWLDTYGPYTPEPPLAGDTHADVVIIGGGFTGVVAAYEIKRADPSVEVVLLEAQTIGYGASGRNGSFGMTVVGLGFETMAMLRGKRFVTEAHRYMERAVDALSALVERESLDCDHIRPGFLRVATTPAFARRIQAEVELVHALGIEGIEWIDADAVRSRVRCEHYLGAMWEPRLALINPAKLVREERRIALREGVRVFERSPALEIATGPAVSVRTATGTVTADKLVLATNAYSHLFRQTRRKQTPAFTYMVATEPLTEEQLGPIGWKGREGIEDARNLIHYYRLTPDNRLVMGGGPVGITWAGGLDADRNEVAWRHLEEHIHLLFPSLRGVHITHRWGGPFSVTLDLTPAIGHLGDSRTIYSLGCIGHGVSMSHLNAQLIRDLVLDKKSDLQDCPFYDRRVIPWPPEPLRSAAVRAIRGYLRIEDWVRERPLHRAGT